MEQRDYGKEPEINGIIGFITMSGRYTDYEPDKTTPIKAAILDGQFSVSELEEILAYMRSVPQSEFTATGDKLP